MTSNVFEPQVTERYDYTTERKVAFFSGMTELNCHLMVLTVAEEGSPSKVWTSSIQEQLDYSRLTKYRLVNRVGKLADQIVAVAAGYQADLIVMGHLSHAAWLRRLIGSTLDRTLRNTELPVLVA